MMRPDTRRIVAVDAYRRSAGRCPTTLHSLGTGESFSIEPTADGFIDIASGRSAHADGSRILLSDGEAPIEIAFDGDVTFRGFDPASGERFSGRTGGGASVTVYAADGVDYFQYAVVT